MTHSTEQKQPAAMTQQNRISFLQITNLRIFCLSLSILQARTTSSDAQLYFACADSTVIYFVDFVKRY